MVEFRSRSKEYIRAKKMEKENKGLVACRVLKNSTPVHFPATKPKWVVVTPLLSGLHTLDSLILAAGYSF
jgi:hypothetical protein